MIPRARGNEGPMNTNGLLRETTGFKLNVIAGSEALAPNQSRCLLVIWCSLQGFRDAGPEHRAEDRTDGACTMTGSTLLREARSLRVRTRDAALVRTSKAVIRA